MCLRQGVEHIDRLIGLLKARSLIPPSRGMPDAPTMLRNAAAELVEMQTKRTSRLDASFEGTAAAQDPTPRATVDVWELLLYWMEIWGTWDPRASLQTRAMPRPQRQRVGEVRRVVQASTNGYDIDDDGPQPEDIAGDGEEDFHAGMRQNAMDFNAADQARAPSFAADRAGR